MKRYILQVFYAIFSGIMLSLAISNELLPLGSPFIALLSLVPLYIALYNCTSYTKCGSLFMIQIGVTHVISSFWLANFHGYAIFTLGASALGTMFEGFLCGLIAYAYPHELMKRSKGGVKLSLEAGKEFLLPLKRALWFTASWLVWELFKSAGALGYPWGTVSMAAYRWNVFNQIADLTGVWGITGLYVLLSSLIAEWILYLSSTRNPSYFNSIRQLSFMVIVFFAVSGIYGSLKLLFPPVPEKELNMVLVQQNEDPWEASEFESIKVSQDLSEREIAKFTRKGEKADLVVWSEGVLNRAFPGARSYYEHNPGEEGLGEFIKRMGVPFLIGARANLNPEKRHYTNCAVLFDKNGKYSGFYSKIHLVPFAEVIPYEDNPLMKAFMSKFVGLSSGWTPGKQFVLFKTPINAMRSHQTPLEYEMPLYSEIPLDKYGVSTQSVTSNYINNSRENPGAFVKFTTPICFEDAFNDVCRRLFNSGSELFITITNDSWSKTPSAEYQHFIVSSYRTIEYRTTLVRCANSGYTVVIGANGNIIGDLPVFTQDALSIKVPVYPHKETIYSRSGDWFPWIAFAGVMCYILHTLFNIYFADSLKNKRLFIEVKFRVVKKDEEK